ncbi:ribonuclease Z [Paenibacillus nasutitermitis]|uniref:Ribonuclease Z n=1 Tax=Paenibacillus nasutitermitis TaxID=1652958 RepID=A0A916YVM4_9BACL|nr:ribonuclease Z [Paenibacillus nasutitermitis]GGD63909.1 ribonuclease Z [Paenibacillus nasutitermitis]
MRIIFLGTSAGRPTKARNVTSIALKLPDPANGFWLIDCGEGTQHRLLSSKLKLNRLERILITHLHGDHIYGLPGLLTSRSYFDGAGPLQIYGPIGIRAYLEGVFEHSGVHLEYELDFIEIDSTGIIAQDDGFIVEAAPLEHRMPSYGYRITELPQPGHLDLTKLAELKVPPGPLYGRLKRGEDVKLAGGVIIRSSDVVGPSVPGRIVTILGDTKPCGNAVILAQGADLLVHEATFGAGMEEKAEAYGHSTVLQAAEIAAKAGVRQLLLTHFSSRFDDEAVEKLTADAQTIFPDTVAARDYLEIHVPRMGSNASSV